MGFGGPVWHASVSHPSPRLRRKLAAKALAGVGDQELGQWIHDRPRAFHLRRRLSEREELRTGPVVDLRKTDEGRQRLLAFLDSVVGHPRAGVLRDAALEEWMAA